MVSFKKIAIEYSMENKSKLLVGFLGFTWLYRLIPHPFNFTPLLSYGLMCGALAKQRSTSVAFAWLPALLSDLILGLYPSMIFNYLAYAIIALIGKNIKSVTNISTTISYSALAASIFYLISNFGVWLMSNTYSMGLQGLYECYLAGLPFYQHSLLGSVLFSLIFSMVFIYITTKNRACHSA